MLNWYDFIEDKPWSYYHLLRNSNITQDVVQLELDKPWTYTALSQNPMLKHPHFNNQLSYILK